MLFLCPGDKLYSYNTYNRTLTGGTMKNGSQHTGVGKLTLHEMGRDREILQRFIVEEADPQEKVEAQSILDQLEGTAIPEKIERWGLWITERTHECNAVVAEIGRLKDRVTVLENAIERSSDRLMYEMKMQNMTDVRGPQVTVAIQLNNPRVEGELPDAVEDAAEFYAWRTEGFIREKPATFELDKKAILAAFKAGLALPEGLRIVRDPSLRIR